MNCWEMKKCGREAGGDKIAELGVCPACTINAGQACWMVAGTFCGGELQGTFAEKQQNCMQCEVYQSYDFKHRTAMRAKFTA